jgi:hypothetical protein
LMDACARPAIRGPERFTVAPDPVGCSARLRALILRTAGDRSNFEFHAKGSHLMNSTPQIATQEISDADLDNVSGGLLGGAIGTAVGTVDSIVPLSGTVGLVTGTLDSVTGVNTSGVLGVVGGL